MGRPALMTVAKATEVWRALGRRLRREPTVAEFTRALGATSKKLADGSYEVTLKYSARKMQADEKGAEQEVPVDDLIEIGVLDKDGNALYLEKQRLKSGEGQVTVTVKGEPARAGIDPLNKLIDRTPNDNVVDVKA